jgi:hypothetical protein
MKDNIKRKIGKMYKHVNGRSVELVFDGYRLKKSIGQRKATSDLLRELNDELDDKQTTKEEE